MPRAKYQKILFSQFPNMKSKIPVQFLLQTVVIHAQEPQHFLRFSLFSYYCMKTFLIFNLTHVIWLHLFHWWKLFFIHSEPSQRLPVFLLYRSFFPPSKGIQRQASVQRISKQAVYGGFVCFTVPAGGLMGVNRGQGRLQLHSSALTEGRSLFRPHRLLVQ